MRYQAHGALVAIAVLCFTGQFAIVDANIITNSIKSGGIISDANIKNGTAKITEDANVTEDEWVKSAQELQEPDLIDASTDDAPTDDAPTDTATNQPASHVQRRGSCTPVGGLVANTKTGVCPSGGVTWSVLGEAGQGCQDSDGSRIKQYSCAEQVPEPRCFSECKAACTTDPECNFITFFSALHLCRLMRTCANLQTTTTHPSASYQMSRGLSVTSPLVRSLTASLARCLALSHAHWLTQFAIAGVQWAGAPQLMATGRTRLGTCFH